jgi:hypothetical protein
MVIHAWKTGDESAQKLHKIHVASLCVGIFFKKITAILRRRAEWQTLPKPTI